MMHRITLIISSRDVAEETQASVLSSLNVTRSPNSSIMQ
jgi:hypothetical protein